MKNNFLLIFFLFTFKAIGDDCDCCNCLNFCENEENDTLDEKKDNKNDTPNNKNDTLDNGNNILDNKNNILDNKNNILDNKNNILDNKNDILDNKNDILNEENDNKNDILDNEYLSYFKFEEYKNNPEVNEEIENDTIDIFLCIDDAYVYPCLVTIKSIIDNSENKDLLSFFILIPEKFTSSGNIEKFKEKEKCKIQIISMGDKYNKLSEGRRWTTPTYYRFSIPWITKKKKAIYLDSDLLIRKDIKNLFDIDLEGYYYAAVVDGSAYKEHNLPNLKGNIIIEEGNYYNSGVLLLNCDKIREEKPATFADLLLKQETERIYDYLDQDILNIACHNKIKKLSPEYNFVLNSCYGGMLGVYEETGKIYTDKKEEFNSAQENATIVHFTRPKPWNGEYNTNNNNKAGDENFEGWLNFFDLWGLSKKLNITEDLLNSQKVTIVKKYHKEWKEIAAKVVKSVYE